MKHVAVPQRASRARLRNGPEVVHVVVVELGHAVLFFRMIRSKVGILLKPSERPSSASPPQQTVRPMHETSNGMHLDAKGRS